MKTCRRPDVEIAAPTRCGDRGDEAAGGRVIGLLIDHTDRGNGVAAIRDIRRFGDNIPAILITADRSPHVRAAAREENIAVLNKPVKPASLRALLGQWRTQQMVAAE
jgi:CheY-like chemotaxis protein